MMIRLLHFGIGNVGTELTRQILDRQKHVRNTLGIDLVYCGLFTSKHGLYKVNGLTRQDIARFPGNSSADPNRAILETPGPFVMIDTTSSDDTLPLLKLALGRGGSVVTANKRPLASKLAEYDALIEGNRVFFEATVGAGLPIISTLKDLITTGDEVESITGCFSGSLGYILSELEAGKPFSGAVTTAKTNGLTEADPREDLSGSDVARKVVILSRLIGRRLEPAELKAAPLFPDSMAHLSVGAFMEQLSQLDSGYEHKVETAKHNGTVLRYVASVTPAACSVELQEVSTDSDLAALKGPDNMVVIKTKRYHTNPLVIKGPGAGIRVTAAGVFADVIKAAETVQNMKEAYIT